jgi:hypothetical protein
VRGWRDSASTLLSRVVLGVGAPDGRLGKRLRIEAPRDFFLLTVPVGSFAVDELLLSEVETLAFWDRGVVDWFRRVSVESLLRCRYISICSLASLSFWAYKFLAKCRHWLRSGRYRVALLLQRIGMKLWLHRSLSCRPNRAFSDMQGAYLSFKD